MKIHDILSCTSLAAALLLGGCGGNDSKADASKDSPKTAAKSVDDAKAKTDDEAKAEADEAKAKADDTPEAGAEAGAEAGDEAKAEPGASIELEALEWASLNGDKTSIDIISIEGSSPDEDPVMALGEAHDYPDGIDTLLPPDAKLPEGFAVGNEWVVATTSGEARGKAVGFGATGGASESHFMVVLDTKAEGLAARASDWKGTVPTLRPAKATEIGAELRTAIWPGIVAAATADAKGRLGAKGWKGSLMAVEGKYKDGFTHLVVIEPPQTEEIGEPQVAGLVLADATGRVEAVFEPDLTIDTYELQFLVDLQGDGQDEVVLDSSYYEGSYRLILAWNASGTKLVRTLTGDGA